MKIVTTILILSVAILLSLPERAWAPTDMHQITGELISVSVDDDPAMGDPWGRVRLKISWGTSNDNDVTDPDVNGDNGDKRF